MIIEFQCASCGQPMQVPLEHGGKHARCPHCQAVVPVPAPPPGAVAPPASAAPPPAGAAAPPSKPAPAAPQQAGFHIDVGETTGPSVSANRSVTSRYRKSGKNAVQNGVGSIIAGVLAFASNFLCCCAGGIITPFLPLMFEGAMAVIGIMLALNSRGGWKIGGLILNIFVLAWTVLIFLLILGGLTLQDVQQMR